MIKYEQVQGPRVEVAVAPVQVLSGVEKALERRKRRQNLERYRKRGTRSFKVIDSAKPIQDELK